MLSHPCEHFPQGGSTHTESKAFCFLRLFFERWGEYLASENHCDKKGCGSGRNRVSLSFRRTTYDA